MILTMIIVTTSLWVLFGLFLRVNVREISDTLNEKITKSPLFIYEERLFSSFLLFTWLLVMAGILSTIIFVFFI